MFREGIDIGIDQSHLQQTDQEPQQIVEEERIEEEKKLPPALFIQAPYGGDAIQFRGEPTSLLYAVSLFADRVHKGEIEGLSDSELEIMNPPVYDEQFKQDLEKYLYENKPKVIGISCTTSSSVPAREIAETAKTVAAELGYEVIVVMGGAHERDMASMQGDSRKVDASAVYKHSEHGPVSSKTISAGTSAEQYSRVVDFSATGESEETFNFLLSLVYSSDPEKISHLSPDELKLLLADPEIQAQFAQLKGRDGGFAFNIDGQSVRVKAEGGPIDLKESPLLPRHLLDEKTAKYYGIFRRNGQDVKTAQIMTCRGCIGGCGFCSEHRRFNPSDANKVIKEIDDALEQEYKAIFFDDSTFTWFDKNKMEPEIKKIFAHLKEKGVEWGCQTRVDKVDNQILDEMKESGCTYIYLGVESADPEMLEAMHKGVSVEQIEEAINRIDEKGIRIGMSVIFGTEGETKDKKQVTETEESVQKTIDFIKKKMNEGKNIVLVSMNLLTYYPDSYATKHMSREEKVRLAQESYPEREDLEGLSDDELYKLMFSQPIVHRGYPWNRFEDGQGHHPSCVTKELAKYIVEHGVEEIGEVLQGQDLYVVPEIYEGIRSGKTKEYADFNHASITTPKLTSAQREFIEVSTVNVGPEGENLPTENSLENYELARAYAADVFGLPHDGDKRLKHIALAPNTTEAENIAVMIGLLTSRDQQNFRAVTTDAENFSIHRLLKRLDDYSNPHGRDDWSSFQDYGVRGSSLDSLREWPETQSQPWNSEVVVAEILGSESDQEIIDRVDEKTDIVIFSHVIRDNGRVLDAAGICQRIKQKNPNCWILVDGAQALGALPPFDVREIGCDFYVGTPHKTMNSLPFGILYMGDKAVERVQDYIDRLYADEITLPDGRQVKNTLSIWNGMFAQKFGPSAEQEEHIWDIGRTPKYLSPQEPRSFTAQFDPTINSEPLNQQELERTNEGVILGYAGMQTIPERVTNKLSGNENIRSQLKQDCISQLRESFAGTVEIISPQDGVHSNFILSFRFPDLDNRQIVDHLWRQPKPITLSYIARSNLLRISFDQFNTEEEIDFLIESLQEAVAKEQEKNIGGKDESR